MIELATAGAGRVQIAQCDLDSDADIPLAAAWTLLDAAERDRAARFVFDRDRERFVRAHGFVRRGLGAALGLPPEETPILGPEHEKPYVAGRPVEFSLSHSGGLAALAISRGGPVGIDLELLDADGRLEDDLDGVAWSCFTGPELEALAATPAAERIPRFLSFWTAKEARMKLTGEGFALDPQDISLALIDGAPVGYLRPESPPADLRFVQLQRPSTICCLALARDRQAPAAPGSMT